MKFNEYLSSKTQDIEKELLITLDEWSTKNVKEDNKLLPFLLAFKEQCSGGKGIRGALVLLGYELASNKDHGKEILQCAAAIEIFQTAILSHDDIIDQSPIRRNKPSLYAALGGDHYGISQTISLGDLGFFLTLELLGSSDFSPELKNKAVTFFSHTAQLTALGQMLDVLGTEVNDFTLDDLIAVAYLKTAFYSVIAPLSIGAILGGGDDLLLQNIKLFGENLGIAYQINDDYLGIFGTDITGKSQSSDIESGKETILILQAKANATETDKQTLDQLYGKKDASVNDIEQIQEIFKKTGAADYAKKLALEYSQKAVTSIPTLTKVQEKSDLLSDMVNFLSLRNK